MRGRILPWVVLLAATLHLIGMARTDLPAQDGLKFLRVAREFQTQPWGDAIRGSDQHPLYPACIALAEPVVRLFNGEGPTTWRIAAQGVSVLASLLLLLPLHGLARSLFDERTANLSVLLFVLLPLPGEVGHDTLSDPLALLGIAWALRWGEETLRTWSIGSAVGCGLASGLGFWARPEAAVVPLAVLAALLVRTAQRWRAGRACLVIQQDEAVGHVGLHRASPVPRTIRASTAPPAVLLTFLTLVGSYALIKGEVSEKLALRRGAAIASKHDEARAFRPWMPEGLDDPRWDFSPKEETGRTAEFGPTGAIVQVAGAWAEGLGWVLAPLALWGAIRVRSGPGKLLVGCYVLMFGLILVRHTLGFGYLSGRHTLSMVLAALPWAAAGLLAVGRGLARSRGWDETGLRRRRVLYIAALVALGVGIQLRRPGHPSRWGHRAAGHWLAANAGPGDAVLDTRGWAAFVSGKRSYDYWHVRQALSDSRLAYVVVVEDELRATSRRADTLRALLAYAGEPVGAFPERAGGSEVGVRVYRFRRPESWEGMRP